MTIVRTYGGADLERVFLRSANFHHNGEPVCVEKSDFPGLCMGDVLLRHIGRYGVALPFIRPGYKVLDFPCGSGLALEVLAPLATFGTFWYEGRDVDPVAVAYASHIYSDVSWARFQRGDLTSPLDLGVYDTIMCIEGFEHIASTHQARLVRAFHAALRPSGTLIISSPAPESGISGPNPNNQYHLCELNAEDMKNVLSASFGTGVEMISQTNRMSTGVSQLCHYAICHK